MATGDCSGYFEQLRKVSVLPLATYDPIEHGPILGNSTGNITPTISTANIGYTLFQVNNGTSLAYLQDIDYSNTVDGGCLPVHHMGNPTIGNVSVSIEAQEYFEYGGRYLASSGEPTNTDSPTFYDIYSPSPLPWCVREKDEEGNPFSQWDGSTVFPDSTGRPSKYNTKAVTVYGNGSDFCIELSAAEVSNFYYKISKIAISPSVVYKASAANATGSVTLCIDGTISSKNDYKNVAAITGALPTQYVDRKETASGQPLVITRPNNPELNIFSCHLPIVSGACHGTNITSGIGNCLNVSTTNLSGATTSGAQATMTASCANGTVLSFGNNSFFPNSENIIFAGGSYWYKPPHVSISAYTSLWALKSITLCEGTTTTKPTKHIVTQTISKTQSHPTTSATPSSTSSESTSSAPFTGTTESTPPTTNTPLPTLAILDLSICDFMKVVCGWGEQVMCGPGGDGGGINCPSGLIIADSSLNGIINPDYEPPGYAAANAAWKASLESINLFIEQGTKTSSEIEVLLKISNWDAFNAASVASAQFTQDVGYSGPVVWDIPPVAINPTTGDPVDSTIDFQPDVYP
jgi:hypothetical protein